MANSDVMQRHVPGLLTQGWQRMEFEPFSQGVDICWIKTGDPGVALLRYQPGARVPKHTHTGLETILVLAGSQSDEQGTYRSGSLVLNPEGTSHSVWSDDGCVVLIEWERPVRFVEAGAG